MSSDLRVGFLAERIETVCIAVSDRYARWIILSIYFDDIEHRYAVRATEWEKHPDLPSLDLSRHETDLVYHMCDILSRKRAFQENIDNIDRQISLDLVSNVHRAKELGKFDETRFIGLLTTDPLALPVLEATLFAAVWSEAALENAPQFILNFMLPSTQAATVREYVAEHFHAVDLLRSIRSVMPSADSQTRSNAVRMNSCFPAKPRTARSPRSPSQSPPMLYPPLTRTTCLCLRTRTLSGKKMPTVCDWLPRSCCGMYRTPRAR